MENAEMMNEYDVDLLSDSDAASDLTTRSSAAEAHGQNQCGEEEEVSSAWRQPVFGTSSAGDDGNVWRRVDILERSGPASKSTIEEIINENHGAWRRVVIAEHWKPTAAVGGDGVVKKTIRIRRTG